MPVKPILLIIVLLAELSASWASEVYRYVDPEGNVIFTDQPPAGAERVIIDPAPPIRMEVPTLIEQRRSAEAIGQPRPAAAPTRYSQLEVITPAHNTTISGGKAGVLIVELTSTPKLATDEGDTVTILINGKPEITNSTGMRHAITGIEPDVHDVQALIKRGDRTLIQSDVHRFLFLHE